MRILVLTIQTEKYKFVNNFLVPDALRTLGHEIVLGDVDTLCVLDGVVSCRQADFKGGAVGEPHVKMDDLRSCEDFDLAWVLDTAHHTVAKEYYQILWVLENRVQFVNRPSSMYFLNNKIGVLGLAVSERFPQTSVVLEEGMVHEIVSSDPDSPWILKPPNSGCGADVYMLRRSDPNYTALVQSATGNAYQKYEMFTPEAYGRAEKYAVVQRFIPELKGSEFRVLIAGGKVVGGFKKTGKGTEFRGNASTGGIVEPLELSREEVELCEEVGSELAGHGINFVGIDMAFPYLVEYNMVNPGAINYHYRATGEMIGLEACQAVIDKVAKDH